MKSLLKIITWIALLLMPVALWHFEVVSIWWFIFLFWVTNGFVAWWIRWRGRFTEDKVWIALPFWLQFGLLMWVFTLFAEMKRVVRKILQRKTNNEVQIMF